MTPRCGARSCRPLGRDDGGRRLPEEGRPRRRDDHPPSDLRAGQKLVLQVADAVLQGPAWKKTLLVFTYDEHGGFFDDVQPPPTADDRTSMRRSGPRVPALVVSPYVAAADLLAAEPARRGRQTRLPSGR